MTFTPRRCRRSTSCWRSGPRRWVQSFPKPPAASWRCATVRSSGGVIRNAEPDRQRLALINSVLSVVIGGHFPLGGIPWPQIEKAREVLASLAE